MTLERMLVTEPIFGQSMALVAFLAGTLLIVAGVRMSRQATPSRWQTMPWLRQISRMARGEDSHVYDLGDLRAVWRQWLHQLGAALIGAGVGILVGALVSFGLAQLALHAPFSLPEQLFWFCVVPPMWGTTLGFTFGSLAGARQRATARGHDATVADALISRKVLDYRSPLLTVIVAIPAVVYTTLTFLMAPKYSPFDAFDLYVYLKIHGHELVLPPHWILAIYPGAMWLTVLLVECCAWVRVNSAARITTHDAALARSASMALTGQNLSIIYGLMMATPAQIIGLGVMVLLTRATHALNWDSLILMMYGGIYLLGFLSMMLVLSSEGRLGGRLTGWSWSNRASQEGAASAEG